MMKNIITKDYEIVIITPALCLLFTGYLLQYTGTPCPRTVTGFCRCFAFRIGKIRGHNGIIRNFQFRKFLPMKSNKMLSILHCTAAICFFICNLPDITHAGEEHHQPLFIRADIRVIRQVSMKCFLFVKYPSKEECPPEPCTHRRGSEFLPRLVKQSFSIGFLLGKHLLI